MSAFTGCSFDGSAGVCERAMMFFCDVTSVLFHSLTLVSACLPLKI